MVGSEWRKERYSKFTELVPSLDAVEISKFVKSLARSLTVANSDVIKNQSNQDMRRFCKEKSEEVVEYVLQGNLIARDSSAQIIRKITQDFTYPNSSAASQVSGGNVPRNAAQPVSVSRPIGQLANARGGSVNP